MLEAVHAAREARGGLYVWEVLEDVARKCCPTRGFISHTFPQASKRLSIRKLPPVLSFQFKVRAMPQ